MRRARRESMGERDRHEVDWLVDWRRHWADWNHKWAEQAQRYGEHHAEWHRQWAKRMERHVERDRRRSERRAGRNCGPRASWAVGPEPPRSEEEHLLQRARSRAAAEMGFYVHLTSYLGVIALLALINLMTTWYPWFLWPAIGWGFGLCSHWMGVFGSRALKARYFDPAVERELVREKAVMQTEKQASLDELSSTIAHEIRNPIAAAKSLVQQMGEDPALGRERRVRQGGARRARSRRAPDRAPAQVRQGGGLRDGADQPRHRGRRGAHAAPRQARRRQGRPGAQLHHRPDDRRRRREADARCSPTCSTTPSTPSTAVPENRRDRALHRERRAATRRCACATTAAASRRTSSSASSIPSSPPRRRGPGSAWRSRGRSSRRTPGTIDVASEVGRGTEFVVTLPLPE